MTTANCPHCGVANEDAAQFCVSCGKALPAAAQSGPHVVTGQMVASTDAGLSVQVDHLGKRAKQAFGALLAVAILNTIGGVIIFLLFHYGAVPDEAKELAPVLLAINLVVAAIYAGLAMWARSNPLPAAVVGLVLFISVHLVAAIINPLSIAQGIIVKIIIIVLLVRAIQAGIKHRQLTQSAGTGI